MKVELKTISISDLLALKDFVASKPFSTNERAKTIIKGRLLEIEEELMNRAFGLNPYKAESKLEENSVRYEGIDPLEALVGSIAGESKV